MPPIITQPTRFRYEESYRKFQLKAYPSATKSFGFLGTKYPDTRKANGLTMFILNFLKWEGWRATRISSAGRIIKAPQRQESGVSLMTAKYIPGQTRRGTADISATIHGRSVMLEVKVGADRPSEWQLREKELEEAAGGVYEFIHTPEEFILFYDRFLLTL